MKRKGNHLLTRFAGRGLRGIAGVSLLLLLFAGPVWAQNKRAGVTYSGAEAARIVPGASYVKIKPVSPFPSFIRMSADSRQTPAGLLEQLKQVVKATPELAFVQVKQSDDELGMIHYQFEQRYQDIPVVQSTYRVHVTGGVVNSVNGQAYNLPAGLSAKPVLKPADALEAAKRHFEADRYKWEDPYWERHIKERKKDNSATYFPEAELCWYAPNIGRAQEQPSFKLTYRLDIHAASPDFAKQIYIDAANGAILQVVALESNCSGASVNTIFNGNRNINTDKYTANDWRLRDDCQAAQIRIRDWNSATCTASPLEIDNTTNTWTTMNERFGGSVLWAAIESQEYWQVVHGRSGYDGANGDVEGYINATFSSCGGCGCPYTDNASMSFSGGTMKVGLGSGGTLPNSWSTLDIIAHEFAHAVTGSSAELVYQDESGALNESFSDIFGEATENRTLGSNDWLMGDERADGAIRSFSNPNTFGDPDTYGGTNWCDYTNGSLGCTMNDAGGVHRNSGVQNHWFYLLTVGGSGTNDNLDAYTVSGIGLGAARAIAARNLLVYLGENSDYSDARDGAIQAASDLYGACSNEVKQTTNAWYAVGIGAAAFDATATVTSNYNGRDVSCHDACDGSATVNVTSGAFPTYNWSNGATTQSVSGLCPGNYTVTVTNILGLGCSVTRNLTIDNTPALQASPAVTTNYNGYGVSCFGFDNGAAAANASGGTPPYTYNWSNGQTGSNATGLDAGLYTVTVTDANGCTANGNVTVTEPPQLTTSAAPTSNYNGYHVRCFGGSDGTAEAYPAGGVPPYSYDWSNGQTTKTATGLMATNYTVTVTDANGCSVQANTLLTEPPQLTIDAGANQTVYFGYPDSACADLTATGMGGGVGPYTLHWSTGSNNTSINVCPAGTTVYTVTITDQNNCSMSDDVKVCVIDVRCGNKLDKVTICHNTGKGGGNTLCIALPAVATHLANHGDQLAACGTVKTCEFGPMARYYDPGQGETNGYLVAFPNPSSSSTTIKFRLEADGQAILRIFDLAGRELSVLHQGPVIAGDVYEVPLEGSKYPSGVYLLMLETDYGDSRSIRLVLTK